MVAHALGGAELDPLLDWLEKKPQPNYSAAALNSMKTWGLKPPQKD